MGLNAAAGGAQRMLDVQHFVKEHVFDGVPGNTSAVEPAVQDDLIERRVEAAELSAPSAVAPTEARAMQASFEVAPIEAREHRGEVVDRAAGACAHAAAARAAKRGDTTARARQEHEAAISAENFEGRAAAVNAGQENGGGGLEYGQRRAAQSVRQTHVRGFITQANGVHQVGVGIKLDFEARRAPAATQTRIEALEDGGAAGNGTWAFECAFHCGLRRTGGGAFSLMASAASRMASLVASMASSRFSL